MAIEHVRMHLMIRGSVQGVSYRAAARGEAEKLGVVGWVKNLPNGHVELMAAGPRKTLEKFLGWAKKGPPSAKVSDVSVRWGGLEGPEFAGFEITQ